MSEIIEPGNHYSVEQQDLDYTKKVYSLVEQSVKEGTALDQGEAAFLVAFRRSLLLPGGIMRPHMDHIAAMNRQRGVFIPHGQMLRRIEFSIDKQVRRTLSPEDYVRFMPDPEFWEYMLPKIDQAELFADSRIKLQSNMADAGAINHLVTNRLSARWGGRGITALNNGISLGIPDKKWMLEGFRPIKVVKAPAYYQPIVPGEMESDEEVQEIIDELSAQEPVVEKIVGYDIEPVIAEDPAAADRLFSDTFPFMEASKRPEEVDEFIRLARTTTDKVVVVPAIIDARDAESLGQLGRYLPNGADVSIYSAFLFEQRLEEIYAIGENTAEYTNEGAVGIASDFFDKKFQFIRGSWWHRPGSWATAVFDMRNPQNRFMLGQYTTRRGTEMWLTEEGRRFFLTGELPF